uniref:Uncharacterized protein n=1 Tax=Arundo donax TaxID=35708 RepID=A0A0A8Y564_ARUDO
MLNQVGQVTTNWCLVSPKRDG